MKIEISVDVPSKSLKKWLMFGVSPVLAIAATVALANAGLPYAPASGAKISAQGMKSNFDEIEQRIDDLDAGLAQINAEVDGIKSDHNLLPIKEATQIMVGTEDSRYFECHNNANARMCAFMATHRCEEEGFVYGIYQGPYSESGPGTEVILCLKLQQLAERRRRKTGSGIEDSPTLMAKSPSINVNAPAPTTPH